VEVSAPENPPDPAKPFLAKINGQEVWLSKDELIAGYQKGHGAERKFAEAATMRKQAEQFLHLLRTDPKSILLNPKLGLDMKQLAQEILLEDINLEMMTDEQRELHLTKKKLADVEREKAESQQRIEQQQQAELVKRHSAEYEKDIMTTLETAGLPKTRSTVRDMAYFMSEGLRLGVPLKAADVVDLVKQKYTTAFTDMFASADGQMIANLLGEAGLKKIREFEMQRLSQPGGGAPPHTPPPAGSGTPPPPVKKLSKEEWIEQQKQRFGNR